MSKKSKDVKDEEIQTIVQKSCLPDVLFKTDDARDPEFFSCLEYTPFQKIQEDNLSVRIPKRTHKLLYHNSISLSRFRLQNCLLIDDDALSEICLELRERVRKGIVGKLKTYKDAETQTILHAEPHILDNEEVAMVVAEKGVQTGSSKK